MRTRRIIAAFAGAAGGLYLMLSGLRAGGRPKTPGFGPPPRVPSWMIVLPMILSLMVVGALIYVMFINPRMRNQPKATPYRALIPAPPVQIVPAEVVAAPEPPLALTPSGPNPLSDTEQTRRVGQVYYGYYCAFCHGQDGRGDGPVGLSYVPTPADLTAARIQRLSDPALYRAMLVGVGHHPVLPYVVLSEAPWHIVIYVRHLPAPAGEPNSSPAGQR
jgi:hypothetical protein